MQVEEAADVFEELRPYLNGVAYRMTSSWADAEDLVADAWPRWASNADSVNEPRAWLTRVVGRLALDHLRSARVRRESYVGPWLPEPLVTRPVASGAASRDPLDVLVADESVRMAFLVVLDHLTPEQRVAVVLHDVLRLPFSDVAAAIGCTIDAARQHASRGRRHLDEAAPPPRVDAQSTWELLDRLSAALQRADAEALTALLAPEVVMTSDGAGEVNAARRPLLGRDDVVRFLHGLSLKADRLSAVEPILVNGDPGILFRIDSPHPRDGEVAIYTVALRDGVIVALYAVLAPAKLTRIPGRPRPDTTPHVR